MGSRPFARPLAGEGARRFQEGGEGELIYKYVHICPECSDLMRDASSGLGSEPITLKCAVCGDQMTYDPKARILWD